MYRLSIALVIASLASGAPDDWRDILSRVRSNVSSQVAKSTNYTCVQTVDRTYFSNTRDLLEGCAFDSQLPDKKKVMHDRLRLDIAVSQGYEIFAWHGEGKFSGSSRIADVVQRGTLSSGEFIGFLQNIFHHGGIRFEFTGEGVVNGLHTYKFNYNVPLSSSGYHVKTTHGNPTVPFHGTFSVRASDAQLLSLNVIPDALPEDSQICSVETDMQYQIVQISGLDALIPSLFLLKLKDATHIYTISRNEYSQCHAFQAESTLRFDVDEDASSPAPTQPPREERLPAGTLLHIALRTPIDDQMSYTGDRVEGELLNTVKLKGAQTVIPKGAVATGVITLLEDREEPKKHFFLNVEFERLTSGRQAFLFRARPIVAKVQAGKLVEVYGRQWPAPIHERYNEGVFVFVSPRLHLDERFAADWRTQDAEAAPASPAAGAR